VQAPYIQAIRGSGGERDWPVTAAGLDEAVRRLPVSPLVNREDGFAHAQLAAAGVPGELDQAMAAFNAAAAHDQNFSMNYFNLGVLRRAAGDPAGARSALETAIEKAPRWGLAWLNRGVVCEETGDTACARESYAQALRLAPGWVSDPFWQETELRAGIAAAVSVPTVEVLSMDAAMRQSYTRPVLELAKVKIAAGELDDAEKLLKLAPMLFMLYEDDVSDLTWLKAELAAAQGNRAEAVKLGTDARKEYVTFRSNDIMATGIYVYGPWIYLLQTTGEDLVPQAVWMEYPGDWSARMEQLKAWQE